MIHFSIFFFFHLIQSQGPKQGHPKHPCPRTLPPVSKVFPGHLGDAVTPACPGSPLAPPPGGTCKDHLPRETLVALTAAVRDRTQQN